MQNHKDELTSKQIAERERLLAHGLPEGYGEEVPEMDGEEDPRSRHERRADAARARKKKAREAKIRARRNRARKNKRGKKRGKKQ